MKIIERIFTCFLDSLLGDGQNLDTFEDLLIGIGSIAVPFLIYFAVYLPLKKYAKWERSRCNVTAILVTVGAILLFCMVCIAVDPPK